MVQRRKYATREELVELLAARAHGDWMAAKQAQGVTSRRSEWGEEFMVPYADLSERAKDIDRSVARGTLDALATLGTDVDALVKITTEEDV